MKIQLHKPASFPPMLLRGDLCTLRPPTESDFEDWAALRAASRGFLQPWEPTWSGDALTHEAFRRRLRRYAENWQADAGYALFAFTRPRETLVGGVTLTNLRRGVVQSVSLGYWIGQQYARRGIMTDAVRATLGFCFGELDLHRIEAACLPTNEPSRRLLQRLGFTEEGFAREYLLIDGAWRDHLLFGLLRSDWRGRQTR